MSWESESTSTWEEPTLEEILKRQSDIKLNRFKCAVIVGVGGIGYWIAKLLALSRRADVIVLVDPEYVEPVNLNRMDMGEFLIGVPKVEATKDVIEINIPLSPEIKAVHDKYSKRILKDVYWACSDPVVVFEAVDHIETSNRVVKDAREIGFPVISVHYDGVDHITLSVNEVHGEWGEGSGYVHTPSFAVPAVIAGALAVWVALTSNIWNIEHTWYFSISEWFA